ncbi:MAG: phosphoglycerate mutase, partial [Alphaproteobacteria bacterium]
MSTTRLLIARHGNTFSADDILCRVGAGTDIPLVESGRRQAKLLGQFLAQEDLIPDLVYSSRLQRAAETATLALAEMPLPAPLTLQQDDSFNEIDYGIDEGKPEDEVVARLGIDALQSWDQDAIVPEGWHVDPQALIQNWLDFGAEIA